MKDKDKPRILQGHCSAGRALPLRGGGFAARASRRGLGCIAGSVYLAGAWLGGLPDADELF